MDQRKGGRTGGCIVGSALSCMSLYAKLSTFFSSEKTYKIIIHTVSCGSRTG